MEIISDGKKGEEKALAEDFDLILLDLMLPSADGFSICRVIRREKDTPILMVSARQEEIDKVRGLGLGADDYIVKPFSPNELTAHVKAHIARYERLTQKTAQKSDSIFTGGLEICPEARRVFTDGKEVSLTRREFDLLLFFAENPGIAFSKDKLFDRIWGMDALGDTATVMDRAEPRHARLYRNRLGRRLPLPQRRAQGLKSYGSLSIVDSCCVCRLTDRYIFVIVYIKRYKIKYIYPKKGRTL